MGGRGEAVVVFMWTVWVTAGPVYCCCRLLYQCTFSLDLPSSLHCAQVVKDAPWVLTDEFLVEHDVRQWRGYTLLL